MASVGKKDFLMTDMKALAAKYGVDKSGTKQMLVDRISTAIECGGQETLYKYYQIGG